MGAGVHLPVSAEEANGACALVKRGFTALTREPRGVDSGEKHVLTEGISVPLCPFLQAHTRSKEPCWLLPLFLLSLVRLHGPWGPPSFDL